MKITFFIYIFTKTEREYKSKTRYLYEKFVIFITSYTYGYFHNNNQILKIKRNYAGHISKFTRDH